MRGAGRMAGMGWWRVASLSVFLALGVGGSALAQQGASREPSSAISGSDPGYREAAERDRERVERLRTPEAREERRRSRERYRDSSRAEALALARREFPEIVRDRPRDGRRPAPGLEVVDQLGQGAALVEDAQGGRFLLDSSDPLQVAAPGGGFEPLDMSLEPSGQGFAPAASAAPLQIGGRVGDGVELTDAAFSLVYEGRPGAEVIETDDHAFAGEVATDTDLVVAPRPRGVEVGWVVRSPQAPESFALRVEMPEGAVLRRARSADPIPGDPPETIEVARGDEVLGYIYPPLAYDADGTEVPSKAEIDGDRIVVSVDHRDGDFRLPILVDPEVVVQHDFDKGWRRWTFQNRAPNPDEGTSASDPGYNFFGAAVNDLAYAPGLYQSMPTHTYYDNYAYAHWIYQAPANTYIYRATLGAMSHSPSTVNGIRLSNWFQGLFKPPYSGWESGVNYQDNQGNLGPNPFGPNTIAATNRTHDFCFLTRCDRTKGTEQNFAIFGIQAINPYGGGLYTGESRGQVPMGYANIYLGDRRAPTVTGAPSSNSQWVNDNGAQHTATISASDQGLGLKSYTLAGTSAGTLTGTESCTGNLDLSPCRTSDSWSFSYRLNEGVRTLTARARDIVDNLSASRTWTHRIDRSAPSAVTLSGPLYERRGRAVGSPLKLNVAASDQWSGVRKLQLLVDGADVEAQMPGTQSRTQGDPGTGGGMSGELDFDPSVLTPGRHTVRVRATDGVNLHRDSETIEVIVDRTKPQLTTVDGSLRRPFVEGAVHDLNITAEDPATDGVAGGMERIELFLRDPSGTERSAHTATSDGGPSISTTFSFDATAEAFDAGNGYAQGRHRVRVTARDQAGNQADEVAFPVVVDREGPELTLSGSLAERDGQTIPEGEYQLDINASDGLAGTNDATQRSGVTQLDVFVNEILVDSYQAPCPEGNCSVQRSVPFNTEDLPGGRQDIEVVALDALGNQTSDTLTVTTPCCLDARQQAGLTLPLDRVAYGDVNGDSQSDLVAVSPIGTVSVALSDGQVFGGAQQWGTIALGAPFLVGDVNGDGKHDIVTRVSAQDPADLSRQLVQVHLSDGQQFGPAATWGEWRANVDLRLADLDGDGLQDLIGRNQDSGAITTAYSMERSFEAAGTWETVSLDQHWDAADANGDSYADLITYDPNSGQLELAASDSGGFASPVAWGTVPAGSEIHLADVDGNNADDLILRAPDTGAVRVGASDRERFTNLANWGTVAGSGSDLALTDVGGDGPPDFVTRDRLTGLVTVSRSHAVAPIFQEAPYERDPALKYDDTDGLTTDPEMGGFSTFASSPRSPFTKIAWADDSQLVARRMPPDNLFGGVSREDYDRSMWRIRQAGGTVVRITVLWGLFMREEQYRQAIDTAVDRMHSDGRTIYMTLTGANYDNFEGQRTNMNPDPEKFAEFVTAAVNRYKLKGVRRYAMWNEPNLPSRLFLDNPRCPGNPDKKLTTAVLYGQLYRAGYDAAKAADPSARIHIGEFSEQANSGYARCSDEQRTSLNVFNYLSTAVGDGVRTHGVAWHPYQHRTNPRDADRDIVGIGRISGMKARIENLHRDGKLETPEGEVPRLYLTEFGYFNRPFKPGLEGSAWHSEAKRAGWLPAALDKARARDFDPAMFLFWTTVEAPPVNKDRLHSSENFADGQTVFDTGMISPDEGRVTGIRDYGKTRSQPRRAYCAIRRYARINNYPIAPAHPSQPDQCP